MDDDHMKTLRRITTENPDGFDYISFHFCRDLFLFPKADVTWRENHHIPKIRPAPKAAIFPKVSWMVTACHSSNTHDLNIKPEFSFSIQGRVYESQFI